MSRDMKGREFHRRALLKAVSLGTTGFLQACRTAGVGLSGGDQLAGDGWSSSPDLRPLARFPEKAPMILLTDRPPQLETPLRYFLEDFTPNEALFVRWHFAGIPTEVNGAAWRLDVTGSVNRPLQLSLDDLRHRFETVSLVAVNQCSGNSRGLFDPRVPGGQWRHGAMGNARWTGVRLKDMLDGAGVRARAVEVAASSSLLPKPANLLASRFTDERLSAVLWKGVYGSAMPAWREYSEKDLRNLVVFIQQQPRATEDPASPDSAAGDKAQSLFIEHCASCHGEQGDGRGPAAGALAPAPANFHLEQPTRTRALDVLEHGIPGTAMPSWTGKLSGSDRRLLSGYIRLLFATPTILGKEQSRD
jgi:cytochrome c553